MVIGFAGNKCDLEQSVFPPPFPSFLERSPRRTRSGVRRWSWSHLYGDLRMRLFSPSIRRPRTTRTSTKSSLRSVCPHFPSWPPSETSSPRGRSPGQLHRPQQVQRPQEGLLLRNQWLFCLSCSAPCPAAHLSSLSDILIFIKLIFNFLVDSVNVY